MSNTHVSLNNIEPHSIFNKNTLQSYLLTSFLNNPTKNVFDKLNYLDSHSFEEAIFISPSGERLTEKAVQYILKKFNVNPQKLRHNFCQRLIDNKVDLESVSRLAGHKDINVTKRYIKSQMNKQKLEEDINNAFMDKQ